VLIIDSHVHTGVNWSEPVDVLLHQMDTNDVAHACLVQHNGNYDNSYILDCAKRYDGRFKVIGLIDLPEPNRDAKVRELHKQGGTGFRINLRKENTWDPENSGFKVAGELGMIISVIGRAENFGSVRFKQLLDNCPNTHFCLEHLVRSPGEDAKPPYDVYQDALACSQWANTSVKVPGLGEILAKPARLPTGYTWGDEFPPHYQMCKDAYGVQRMMWGSNFPPSAAKEGYRNTLVGVRDMPIFANDDDVEWIMGKTAAKLWGFTS
jgi:L-fuconolactonase